MDPSDGAGGDATAEYPTAMTHADRRIVELLCRTDIALSPAVVAHNLSLSRSWAQKRLEAATNAAVANRVAVGLYRVTELGHRLCRGELSQEERRVVNDAYTA